MKTYTNTRDKRPLFTVFKDEKEVIAGQFEYGGGSSCSYSWRLPTTVFGQLKVVPSADLGQLGPQKGEAASFNWKWYYSASGLAIWLALILALVFSKSNRQLSALLILLPVVFVNLTWLVLKKMTGMTSPSAIQVETLVHSMAIDIAVLWLTVGYFKKFRGIVRLVLSLGTLVIVTFLGVLSYSTEYSNETAIFLVLFIFMALTMMAAITLSRRFCAGKYRPVYFMSWLVLWTVLCSLVAMFGIFVVGSLLFSSGQTFFEAILMLLIAGSVLGLGLYVLNFPFMILGFTSTFYRERFCASLGLKPMPVNPEQAEAGWINEENSGIKISEKGDSA